MKPVKRAAAEAVFGGVPRWARREGGRVPAKLSVGRYKRRRESRSRVGRRGFCFTIPVRYAKTGGLQKCAGSAGESCGAPL